MKNILARGGVEFVAVFLGIALSLWVDEYQKSKEAKKLNKQILTRLHDNLEAILLMAFGISRHIRSQCMEAKEYRFGKKRKSQF